MRKATDAEARDAYRQCVHLGHRPKYAACTRCRAAVIRATDHPAPQEADEAPTQETRDNG